MTVYFKDAFYQHVDDCAQCRENPFFPCHEGDILLRAAALEAEWTLERDRKKGL